MTERDPRAWWRSLLDCLRAESIKVGGGAAVFLSVVLPLALVVAVAIFVSIEGPRLFSGGGVSPALWLAHTTLSVWTFVLLPVHLALVSSHTAHLEQAAGGWTMLFTQPVPRTAVYTAKNLAVLCLVGLALTTLGLGIVAASVLLQRSSADLDFSPSLLLGPLVLAALQALAAAALPVALQVWIAVRSRDLMVPMLAGFGGFLGLIVLRAIDSDLLLYWPWAYPNAAAAGWLARASAVTEGLPIAATGLVAGALLAAGAAFFFTRRDLCED